MPRTTKRPAKSATPETPDANAGAAELPGKPERTPAEQALVDAWQDETRIKRPPKFKAANEPGVVYPDARDKPLWGARLARAMGIEDRDLMSALLNQAANSSGLSGVDATNVAVAAIQAIGPRDGVEAMLAVQMASTHAMAMRMLQRVASDQPTIEVHDSIVNRATKLLRTFTAQTEALKRYRSKGEQRVVVQHQHVNVTADKAAVQVNGAPLPLGRGEGADSETEGQAHALAIDHDGAEPMWGADPARDALRVVAGDGKGPMPDARRR